MLEGRVQPPRYIPDRIQEIGVVACSAFVALEPEPL